MPCNAVSIHSHPPPPSSLSEIIAATCPICLCEPKNLTDVVGCNHQFCFACIWTWSLQSSQCPLCKGSFSRLRKRTSRGSVVQIEILSQASPSSSARVLGNARSIGTQVTAVRRRHVQENRQRVDPYRRIEGRAIPQWIDDPWGLAAVQWRARLYSSAARHSRARTILTIPPQLPRRHPWHSLAPNVRWNRFDRCYQRKQVQARWCCPYVVVRMPCIFIHDRERWNSSVDDNGWWQ
jgi:hypothetical protein